ncbi:prepilin-type N-terminal cleavage/methylation domain-containing protein [Candidatus Parcubacteria bacterium]|nr:prepilin-type N-terminal cleavage/methylation domain-containing protein [Candidatus Parcubacteria bacterium]
MQRGFTFVEVIIGVTIFVIVSMGVYKAYSGLYATLSVAHLKVIAADLINERFEIMRNLPYTDVGTLGGNPPGKIPPSQILVRDNVLWSATTTVINVDDPFDGLSGADTKPNDYKLVEISISCVNCKNFQPVVVTGRIAPRNLEP